MGQLQQCCPKKIYEQIKLLVFAQILESHEITRSESAQIKRVPFSSCKRGLDVPLSSGIQLPIDSGALSRCPYLY